jgi:DNA-binding transcriptional LysR family regulator
VYFDIETRHLRAVIFLAEELSFTRAAKRLGISQPALSKPISELEENYHFQLFNRVRKRVVELTDAGRLFVKRGPIFSHPCGTEPFISLRPLTRGVTLF